MLRCCETRLKKIAVVGTENGANLSLQERTVRLNVMKSLANELQTRSQQFRHAQKDFLTSEWH